MNGTEGSIRLYNKINIKLMQSLKQLASFSVYIATRKFRIWIKY